MTMKCGVWSAECGVAERPAEGAGVWRLGSGVGALVTMPEGGALDRIIGGQASRRSANFGKLRRIPANFV